MNQPPSQFDDPEHWRKHAEQTRTLAEDMNDEASKKTMLRIARDYDRKAAEAEERMRGSSKEPNQPVGFPVNREARLERLEAIDRQIAVGKEHIARQRQIIDDLDREGHDTSAAKELLGKQLATHAAHEDYRRAIVEELGEP
jgi:hypothetical protein